VNFLGGYANWQRAMNTHPNRDTIDKTCRTIAIKKKIPATYLTLTSQRARCRCLALFLNYLIPGFLFVSVLTLHSFKPTDFSITAALVLGVLWSIYLMWQVPQLFAFDQKHIAVIIVLSHLGSLSILVVNLAQLSFDKLFPSFFVYLLTLLLLAMSSLFHRLLPITTIVKFKEDIHELNQWLLAWRWSKWCRGLQKLAIVNAPLVSDWLSYHSRSTPATDNWFSSNPLDESGWFPRRPPLSSVNRLYFRLLDHSFLCIFFLKYFCQVNHDDTGSR